MRSYGVLGLQGSGLTHRHFDIYANLIISQLDLNALANLIRTGFSSLVYSNYFALLVLCAAYLPCKATRLDLRLEDPGLGLAILALTTSLSDITGRETATVSTAVAVSSIVIVCVVLINLNHSHSM